MIEILAETQLKAVEPAPLCQAHEPWRDDSQVKRVLDAHTPFRSHQDSIHIESDGNTIILTGRLPSFYLKQLLQEAFRHIEGIQRIQNDIDVICCNGISSVHGKS